MVGCVVEQWHLPDEGIWEVRGGRQGFLYSRLMCWVAVDRAIRLAERRSFPYPADEAATEDDDPPRGCRGRWGSRWVRR